MEEILASIRQIISEDGEQPAAPQFDQKPKAPEEPESKRKQIAQPAAEDAAHPQTTSAEAHGEAMKPQPSESPAKLAAASVHASPAVEPHARAEPAPARNQRSGAAAPQSRPARAEPDHHLLSAESDASVSSSFSALAHTILAQNARTLEDLVTEMLRPMLQGWLDDNLPSLVERLVKEEIDRVSRGRR
jgi:cell pole-organizing protein PopZ